MHSASQRRKPDSVQRDRRRFVPKRLRLSVCSALDLLPLDPLFPFPFAVFFDFFFATCRGWMHGASWNSKGSIVWVKVPHGDDGAPTQKGTCRPSLWRGVKEEARSQGRIARSKTCACCKERHLTWGKKRNPPFKVRICVCF